MEEVKVSVPESLVKQLYINHLDAIERLDGGINGLIDSVAALESRYPVLLDLRLAWHERKILFDLDTKGL